MKQTLQIKLAPNEAQFKALKETVETFNNACNTISDTAYQTKTFNTYRLHHLVYKDIRRFFGLSAQMTVRAIGKVADAYKARKSVKALFNLHGAMVYDQRILSWKGLENISILTLHGREEIHLRIGSYQEQRMNQMGGQADLILRKNIFYLAVIVEAPEAMPIEPVDYVGVDLGVKNIAVDSDGELWSSRQVNGLRNRHSELRAKLQSKGTRSARRLFKKRSGKEARFASNVNHIVSKKLVAKCKDTSRGIAIEDLCGIRERVTVRGRHQRRVHSSWSFNQLRAYIEYKARIAGVPVVFVDPRNTSRICPACGYVSKLNRAGEFFSCGLCGFAGHADHVAALNIRGRAKVNWPNVSESFGSNQLDSSLGTSPQPSGLGS